MVLLMSCGVRVVLIFDCGIIVMVHKYIFFTENIAQSNTPSLVFSKRFKGQIALARSRGLSGYEGLYTCIIPDENGVNQTLVVIN